MIFLAPRGIGTQVNAKLLANQVSRQWWEELVSPTTRNHLWLTNGLAAYSELLWTEHDNGAGAMESQLRDVMVEALTVDNVPDDPVGAPGGLFAGVVGAHRQQGRGRAEHAALRDRRREVLQDAQGLRPAVRLESVNTDDFRKVAEAVTGQDLGYFFIQWIESSGAPEFKLEYTIFRTAEGLPRDGQDLAGPGHLPHAGGSEDRNRRQSRGEARGSGGHVLGILRGYVRQAQERRHRSRTTACCATARRCAWRWPSGAASSSPS